MENLFEKVARELAVKVAQVEYDNVVLSVQLQELEQQMKVFEAKENSRKEE